MASHGSGSATTASTSAQRCFSSRRRLACQNQKAKKAIKANPAPAMMRKLQNSGQMSGTVSLAAAVICAGVAFSTSSRYFFSSRA